MSSWIDVINRSSDQQSAILAKIIQKQIRSDAQVIQVTDTRLKQIHRTFYDSVKLRDDPYFNAVLRTTAAHTFKLPLEPDGNLVRLWLKFDSGGNTLIDYSYMQNIANIIGNTQPTLYKGPDDGITGGSLASYFNGTDQCIRVTDDPDIRISGFSTTTYTGFTIHVKLQAYRLGQVNGKNTTIFFKTDEDTIQNGYTAQIGPDGNVYFYVKYANTVYQCWASAIVPVAQLPPFMYQNYNPLNFLTDYQYQIDTASMINLDFVFTFATHAMKIYKNGVDVTSGASFPSGQSPNFPPAFVDPGPPPSTDPYVSLYNVPAGVTTDFVTLSTGTTGAFTNVYDVQIPSGGTSSFTSVYSVTGSNSYSNLDNTRSRVGEYAATSSSSLISKLITKVSLTLKKTGSPTGTATITIRRGSDDSIQTTLGTIDVSTLTTSDVLYTFTNTAATYIMAQSDKVLIEYSGGTSSNFVQVKRTGSDTTGAPFDGLNTYLVSYDPTGPQYFNNTDRDMDGTFYIGGASSISYSDLNDLRQRQTIYLATSSSALIGKKITKASFYLHKTGSPTGTLYVRIRKGSDDSIQTTLGTLDVSTLTGTDTSYSFTNSAATYILAQGDRICVEYASGTSSNFVSINRDDDVFDGANTYIQNYDGVQYRNVSTKDMCGQLYVGGVADPNGRIRVGVELDTNNTSMLNQIITRATFNLKKIGSPSGTITVGIRKQSNDTLISLGTMAATSLTTSFVAYTFTNTSNGYNMQPYDKISVEYSGGDANNKVAVLQTDNTITDAFSFDYDGNQYRSIVSKDICAVLYKGGGPYSGPPSPTSQDFADYIHDLLIAVGRAQTDGFANLVLAQFRIYRTPLTTTQSLNLWTNKITISNIPLGQTAVLCFQALPT